MCGNLNTRFPGYPFDVQDSSSQQQNLQKLGETTRKYITIGKYVSLGNMTIMKSRFDRKRKKCLKYYIGQLVLWKGGVARYRSAKVTRKLNGLYTGPYKVCWADHSLDRYTIV